MSGIKGYEKMIRQERKVIRKVHRSAKESNKTRAAKKLTGKSEWFRKEENTDQEVDEEENAERMLNKYLMDGNNQEAGSSNKKEIPTRTVMFVENTKGGELAKRLREVERRTQNMMGFKTKVVEGVGSKLRNLLPNSNPWKGAGCAREGCIPCAQPGEKKQDCRKRNIVYESRCMVCNPEGEKAKKVGKELEDKRETPSIYVGESSRSLHERSKEHWADFEAESGDSHILKHWITHHGGQGKPDFRLEVVKYCRDTLSRQVGEAVRIQYRGNTLNSKAGYNRSGLSRLVLPEKETWNQAEEGRIDPTGLEEVAEPRGLNKISQVPTGGKRKDYHHKVTQPRTKRRKKMKYEPLEDDWGMGAGEELERLEETESAKRRFLMDGQVDKLAGQSSRQTTIRVWTLEETMCRKMLENLVEESVKKSKFMSSLQDNLEMAWVCRQEPLREEEEEMTSKKENIPEVKKEIVKDVQEENKSEKVDPREGQENQKKETIPTGGKELKIPELFRTQERKLMEIERLNLEKEERLERKRRIKNSWKEKRSHYDHLRWAREMLNGLVLDKVMQEGRDQDETPRAEGWRDEPEEVRRARTTGGTLHQTSQEVKVIIPASKKPADQEAGVGEDRVSQTGWKRGDMFWNKVKRLERARQQRDRLIRELEEVWSLMEDEMPGLETELETNLMEDGSQTSRKRKRETSREEEIMRLEEELNQVRTSLEEWKLDVKNVRAGSNNHEEKDSLKTPEITVTKSPVKDMILKFEEKLASNITDMKRHEPNITNMKKHEPKIMVKSPIKLLIEKYGSMGLENESIKKYVQRDMSEGNTSGTYVSGAKPDNPDVMSCAKPTMGSMNIGLVGANGIEHEMSGAKPRMGNSNQSMMKVSERVESMMSSAKPTVGEGKPSLEGVKMKKKVWGIKKNGLYGWRMVVVDNKPSDNIHKTTHKTQPPSVIKTIPKKSQQQIFEKWLVTPRLSSRENGETSDSSEVSTPKNKVKIVENMKRHEHIHHIGFNNPGRAGHFRAKYDKD